MLRNRRAEGDGADVPFRASQVNKAELAPGDVLGLQVGGLDDDAHDQVTSRGLRVHLRG